MSQKTSSGLDANLASVLAYVFGFASGIAILLVEKENRYVRFHAYQSIGTFLPLFVLLSIAHFVPFFGGLVLLFGPLLAAVLWVLLMIKAFQGERYKLPWVGDWAEQQASL